MMKSRTKAIRREAHRLFADAMYKATQAAFKEACSAMIDGKEDEREAMVKFMIRQRARYAKRWHFIVKDGKHIDDPEFPG